MGEEPLLGRRGEEGEGRRPHNIAANVPTEVALAPLGLGLGLTVRVSCYLPDASTQAILLGRSLTLTSYA